MNNNVFDTINKIYSKAGFLEKYGGSLWITVVFLVIFTIIYIYYAIYNNIQPIKGDWVNQRYKPNVMPFAGIINPPENSTFMDKIHFTGKNFAAAVQNIIADIIGYFLAPFYYVIHLILDSLKELAQSVQVIRNVIYNIRTSVESVVKDISSRTLNILIPLQFIIVKIRDMVSKTQGIATATLFTLFGVYQTIIASVSAIIQIVTTILMTIASILIVLYIIPFGLGIPFAIPLLIVFLIIFINAISVYVIEVMVLKKWVNPLPGIPSCFDGETLLTLKNGKKIKMKDIEVGMILQNDNIVTSNMKLALLNDIIYNLNGVLCTGEHSVKYNDNYIKVKNHPSSKKTDIYNEYVYCINTSKKQIIINDTIFSDWDELDNKKIDELKENCNKYLPKSFDLYDFHKHLDGGFTSNTQIELQDGHSINISDIEVNNVLRFGERVIGVVKVKSDDLELKKYILQDNTIVCGGPNLQICDPDLGMLTTLDMYGTKIKEKYVYHLLTDKNTFYVNGVKFYDYNCCIDKYLHSENVKLLRTIF